MLEKDAVMHTGKWGCLSFPRSYAIRFLVQSEDFPGRTSEWAGARPFVRTFIRGRKVIDMPTSGQKLCGRIKGGTDKGDAGSGFSSPNCPSEHASLEYI